MTAVTLMLPKPAKPCRALHFRRCAAVMMACAVTAVTLSQAAAAAPCGPRCRPVCAFLESGGRGPHPGAFRRIWGRKRRIFRLRFLPQVFGVPVYAVRARSTGQAGQAGERPGVVPAPPAGSQPPAMPTASRVSGFLRGCGNRGCKTGGCAVFGVTAAKNGETGRFLAGLRRFRPDEHTQNETTGTQ